MKKLLHKLPQGDVWQCGFGMLPNWLVDSDKAVRPWAILITNSIGQVIGVMASEEAPTPEMVWDVLAGTMRKPAVGKPQRPAALQVRAGECWENLRPHFDEIGIELEEMEKLDEFDVAFGSLSQQMGRDSRPGLLAMPGMTPERVRAFYEAAAEFFRLSPWKRVGIEAAIRISCDQFESGPWFAILIGQSGLTTGLALYEDMGVLRRMWGQEEEDDKENAREAVAISVTFNDPWDITIADLDAATAHCWPVARPDAYPEAFRKERGMSMRQPLAWELALLEGSMRALPEFVQRRRQDDPTREEFAAPTAGGVLNLTLSWMMEVESATDVGT